MRLMTSELLNPCRFTYLVIRNIQLQSPIVLTIRILNFFIIMKFHVIINLGMTCKVHVIST
jgi:hypothetical protein